MKTRTWIMNRQVQLIALSACVLLASSGCSFFPKADEPRQELPEPSGASFTVEYHPFRAKGWQRTFPLVGPTYVSDAVEQANASSKLRGTKVSVMRNVEGTNRVVAMAVMTKRKRVATNTDYAIHNGDRIVIREESEGAFDKMLGFMPEF